MLAGDVLLIASILPAELRRQVENWGLIPTLSVGTTTGFLPTLALGMQPAQSRQGRFASAPSLLMSAEAPVPPSWPSDPSDTIS